MLGHKKIQISLLLAISVIGCSNKDAKMSSRKPFNGTTMVDSQVANAPVAPMPKILPQTHFAAARLLEEQGEIAKAAVQYRKAIAVNHQFVAAYHRLGMLLSKQGQHEEAIKMFKMAVELQPAEAILHNNLGFELMFVDQWAEAREHFGKALELDPKMTRAHVNMGLVLSKLGEFDRALDSFSAVLPEADAYYNMGLMYRGQKQYEDAAKAFEHVLKCNPKFTAAHMQLAELVGYLASPEEKFANKKIEIDGQSAADLPARIDRVLPGHADSIDAKADLENSLDDDVVVITLPTGEKQPTTDDTSGETQKEEWENVFDDLASHYANVESETIENTYEEKTEDTRRDDAPLDAEKTEVALAVPMPRISKITARRTQPVLPRQNDQDFLQHDPMFDDDSGKEVVAMTGLSLEDPEEGPSASANRPAIIPETLDWFRGKLSMVRNEIACLEKDQKMADEMNRPVPSAKQPAIHRSVLVKDNKTDTNSKPKVKKSKPITDASMPRANKLIDLFKTNTAEVPFEEFTGLFKYLFAQAQPVCNLPLRNQDEMISEAIHKLENPELENREDSNQTQLVVHTKSPQDETRAWMLQEFGSSADWLWQTDNVQTAQTQTDPSQPDSVLQADESEQDQKPTTIEQIIHSAKSLVMGMATP